MRFRFIALQLAATGVTQSLRAAGDPARLGSRRAAGASVFGVLTPRSCIERQVYIALARFQTVWRVTPAGVLGLVNLSSSAVSDVIIRLCSGPPIKFANVLPSILTDKVFSASLTE